MPGAGRGPSAVRGRREARGAAERQRLAALLEIGRALGSTLDLDALLNLVMSTVTAAMGADRSTLFLVDARRGELWSRIAQGAELAEIRLPLGSGLAGWVAVSKKPLRIDDAYEDPRFNREFDRLSGYRTGSVLCAPVPNNEGESIGVIQVLDRATARFGAHDEELLGAIAATVGVALQNAQLYHALVEQNAELDVLLDIEKLISQSEGLEVMLDRIVELAVARCGAEAGCVMLREADSSEIFFQTAVGGSGEEVKQHRIRLGQGIAGRVVESGEPVLANDVAQHPGWDPEIAAKVGFAARSALCVPIRAEGDVIGAIELLNKKDGAFGAQDLRLLTLIAGQTARAVQLGRGREERERRVRMASIGQMISSVMHDLKTPLTVMGGYAQLMAMQGDPEQRQKSAEVIQKQVDHVEGMAKEILQFAKGERHLLLTKVYLHQFLAEVEEHLKRELQGRPVELKVEAAYKGTARFDENKIRRVVYNLARNAAQAMGARGGSFTIGVGKDDGALELSFTDTGPGIPPEIADRLFESFVTQGKQDGTGLGLAIVKKVVEDHGGSVTFASQPGQGTTFRVRLPQ